MNEIISTGSRFVSIKEAAKISGISEFQIRKLVKNRSIPFIECGKKYLISVKGLIDYLEAEATRNCKGA